MVLRFNGHFTWAYCTNLLMYNRYLFWRDCLVTSNSAKIKFFSFSVSDWKQAMIRKRNKIVRISLQPRPWIQFFPWMRVCESILSVQTTWTKSWFPPPIEDCNFTPIFEHPVWFLQLIFVSLGGSKNRNFHCPAKYKEETSVWCNSLSQTVYRQSALMNFFF